MKAIFIGTVVLALVSAINCQTLTCATMPTLDDLLCYVDQFVAISESQSDSIAFSIPCATANFTEIGEGDVSGLTAM